MLGAVAALLYGITRIAAARFYSPLGLRPEDLKLADPGLLEAALDAVAYAVLWTAMMFVIAATIWRVASAFGATLGGHGPPTAALGGAVLLAAGVIGTLASPWVFVVCCCLLIPYVIGALTGQAANVAPVAVLALVGALVFFTATLLARRRS